MTDETLFLAALELPNAAARSEYLQSACSDPVLRRQVEALLAAHDCANPLDQQLLNSPLPRPTATWVPTPVTLNTQALLSDAPDLIAGRYKILDLLGQGGMATVYRAQQLEPVKRTVAVKVIKAGMDSNDVLARFEAERQALALMDHPNIARVLDGGVCKERPFFVMELVKGVPITEYCDQHKLTPKQRLELFLAVCQAIQHAHQKGIIHRDIKPSNVLVTKFDDNPVPKVIDFGVAKAMGGALTERTLDTGLGRVVGTPQYMSPEQATFNNLDIDTRSDVYALGVLLYELLTGCPPFAKADLNNMGLLEILRVVREEDPPRPSTRLSIADGLPTLSANRGTEIHSLTRLLRNELDWIVMKALEKDRTRRYDSANSFAMDVQRYLTGAAVHAHPPSTGYQLKKFVRRHRGQVLAAGLVLFSLLAGVIGTTWGLFRAEAARETAEQQKQIAEAKQKEADEERGRAVNAAIAEKAAKEQAVKSLGFARKGNEILGSVFMNLDPRKIADLGRPLQDVLREYLVQAVLQLEGEAIGDPLEVATMQNTLAKSLMGLGEYKQASEVFKKALKTRRANLGETHADTLMNLNNLAESYREGGELKLALQQHQETFNLRKQHLGAEHPDTLTSQNNLALVHQALDQLTPAKALLAEALKIHEAKLNPNRAELLSTMSNLASVHHSAGELDVALPMFEKVLKLRQQHLGVEHPDVLTSMNNLGHAYRSGEQPAKAIAIYLEVLRLRKEKLGPDHPETLVSINNLAVAYRANNQLDKALPLYEESLRLRKSRLGPDHPNTLSSMNNLGMAYRADGKLEAALPLMQEVLKLRKLHLGLKHTETFTSMNNLALVYQDMRRMDLALPLFEEVLALRKANQGLKHPDTLTCLNNYAVALMNVGRVDDSIAVLEETLKLRQEKLGTLHAHTLNTMMSLALAYKSTKQFDKAIPLLEELLPLRRTVLGPEHPDTLHTMLHLGNAYCHTNQGEKGTAQLTKYIELQRKRLPPESPLFVGLLTQVGMDLQNAKQYTVAEVMLQECLKAREKTQPDEWTTFNTQSQLGGTLLGQKKYAEAEPLLLKGYEGMQTRETRIPIAMKPRVPESLDRLIDLYKALNQPELVKKYQDLRAKFPAGPAK